MHLIHRQTCRLCGSSALTKVIDLGPQHLQNIFPRQGDNVPYKRKLPTELVLCNTMEDERACGLLQTRYTVPPEILYSSYWYKSGVNKTMRDHLRGIVDECTKKLDEIGGTPETVLDIGCNDGTLLNCWPVETKKYGVDPSDVAASIENIDNTTIINDFFPSSEMPSPFDAVTFDVITAIAMFYDLEKPASFLHAITDRLKKDGIVCIEVSHMPTMLEMTSYDTICHEHIEYYSLAVLEKLFASFELNIFDAQLNNINGGSIRVFATRDKRKPTENLHRIRRMEFEANLDNIETYTKFQTLAEARRHDLLALLNSIKLQGKKVHIYGASTKGNTILQWCGIGKDLVEAAADRNPSKENCVTATGIPIISEESSRLADPDYYLVLPWSFEKEFLEREKAALERGTRFIFPLPTIQIIGNNL